MRTLVLERGDVVGGAAITTELSPGAHVPTLAHNVGRLRPSIWRDLDLKGHGLRLVSPHVLSLRALAGRHGHHAVGRRQRDRHRDRRTFGARRRAVRRVRPAGPLDRPVPRGAGGQDSSRHRGARARRCAARAGAWTPLSRPRPARRANRAARPADGRRRLRGRGIRDRRAAGRARLAGRRVHRDGPVVGEHRCGPARRFGRQRRRCRRAHRLRRGRSGRADHRAGRCGARRRRRDPDGRRSCRGPLARRPGDRCRAGGWRRDRGARRGQRDRSEADADRSRGPGCGRADVALARRQHPDARYGLEGQPRAVGPADVPRGVRERRAPPPRADRRGDRHRRDGAGIRRRQVRRPPRAAHPRGHDPVAGRPVPRGHGRRPGPRS